MYSCRELEEYNHNYMQFLEQRHLTNLNEHLTQLVKSV